MTTGRLLGSDRGEGARQLRCLFNLGPAGAETDLLKGWLPLLRVGETGAAGSIRPSGR